MTPEMKKKIDDILEEVRDPESGLSVSELGLVRRIRYVKEKNLLYVFTDFQSHNPGCVACAGVAMAVMASILKKLDEAFRVAFPDCAIEFI